MTSPRTQPDHRRQVAERNAEAILDAALRLLQAGGQPTIAAVATEAGVSRVTVYAHFTARDALIEALTRRGMAEVTGAIEAAEPRRGEPADALRRVIQSAWRTLGAYQPLVAINTRLPHAELHAKHRSPLAVLRPLVKRGQAAGAFRPGVPADWHLAVILALIHTASGELDSGRLTPAEVESALVETVLDALGSGVDAAEAPKRQ